MTPRLPRVTVEEIVRALERAGIRLSRQSGSHRIYKNAAGKRVTGAFHSRRAVHPKVLKSILRDADLGIEEFERLIRWAVRRGSRARRTSGGRKIARQRPT